MAINQIGPLLEDTRFSRGMLLIVTFDEGRSTLFSPFSNRVLTILIGDSISAGVISDKPYKHYSLLRLIEDGFGLGSLSRKDADATPIIGIWK